jgi:hypothetical protein
MGSVFVVERLVLVERVQEVGPVDDHQGPVEEFGSARAHSPLHDGVHSRYADSGLHGGDAFVVEDRVEGGGVLAVAARIRCFTVAPASWRSMTRFLARCVVQAAVGWAVAPRMRTRRVACSMTAKTYSRAPVRVRVSKTSAARIACAWPRRKAARVCRSRWGAGSMPVFLRISQAVEGAILMPRVASSPWMRL